MDFERYVEAGDVVEWFPGGDAGQRPFPAVVTGLGLGSIVAISILDANTYGARPVDGVRHVADKARDEERAEYGGWRHRPVTVATREALVELGKLAPDKEGRLARVAQATRKSPEAAMREPVGEKPQIAAKKAS